MSEWANPRKAEDTTNPYAALSGTLTRAALRELAEAVPDYRRVTYVVPKAVRRDLEALFGPVDGEQDEEAAR